MATVEPQSAEWYRQQLTTLETQIHELVKRGKEIPSSWTAQVERLRELAAGAEADIILVDQAADICE